MDSKKPLRKDGILSQQVGDEWLLYDSEEGSVQIVNSVAEFVWRMCDGSHNLNEIEQQVKSDFSVPNNVNLRKDLEKIIQNFADIGILGFEQT